MDDSAIACHRIIEKETINYYFISFHRDNSKLNKNGIHVAANREFKELSVDLEELPTLKVHQNMA